jgi:trimeric autotransporter adhesin
MRIIDRLSLATAAIVMLVSLPAFSHASPKAPKATAPKNTTKATAPKNTAKTTSPKGPKNTTKATSPKGPKGSAKAAKTTSARNAKTTSPKHEAKATAKATKTKGSKAASTETTSTTKTTSTTSAATDADTTTGTDTTTTPGNDTTTANTPWAPTNSVSQKLASKPKLMEKAKAVLPANTDVNLATAGFKNFGQFQAAVNASKNTGIKFADLKAAMTGTTLAGESTGKPSVSLGRAIQQLKPGVDATTEAQVAQTQANAEIGTTR